MRPEDVPDELAEKAAKATWEASGTVFRAYHTDTTITEWDDLAEAAPSTVEARLADARAALAAVLPEVRAEAWIEGRDDGLDDLGATQTAIDYGELTNPYTEF